MDFEEWFKKRHTKTGLYEKSLHGDDDSLYIKHEMEKAFNAGQQSKQAEIDALQKRINEALNVFKSDLSEIGKFDTIHKILKGELK